MVVIAEWEVKMSGTEQDRSSGGTLQTCIARDSAINIRGDGGTVNFPFAGVELCWLPIHHHDMTLLAQQPISNNQQEGNSNKYSYDRPKQRQSMPRQ